MSTTSADITTNYNDLDAGTQTLVKTVSTINDYINEGNKIVTDLNNESTFYGPIAEYCLSTWNKIQNITIDSTAATAAAMISFWFFIARFTHSYTAATPSPHHIAKA